MTIQDLYYALDNLTPDSIIFVWDDVEDYDEYTDPVTSGRYFTFPISLKKEIVNRARLTTEGTLHVLI